MTNVYEKVINDILDGKNEQFEKMVMPINKNIIKAVLSMVQELAAKEANKKEAPPQAEEVIIDRFYSDIPKEEAVALMYEILDNADVVMASKLTRMFVNNRITVDRIKHLIEYYKNEHKSYEIRAE